MAAEGPHILSPWEIVPLTRAHRRDRFDCGVDALNEFLCKYARQNAKKGLGRTFVTLRPDERIVRRYGFTSLVEDTLHMFVSLKAVTRAFRP